MLVCHGRSSNRFKSAKESSSPFCKSKAIRVRIGIEAPRDVRVDPRRAGTEERRVGRRTGRADGRSQSAHH